MDALSLSVSQADAEQRNYSSHFSSFLGFTGKLLTLSISYLINGIISLVAICNKVK